MADKKQDNKTSSVPTHSQLAKLHSVNVKTIGRWKKAGVNIYDEAAVKAHIASKQRGPEEHQKTHEILIPGETLLEQLKNCKTIEQVRFIKTKIESEKAYLQFQVEVGEYTKNSKIKEAAVRVFSILAASLGSKLESELPSKVHGLSVADIQKAARICKEDILRDFQFNLKEAGLS